MPKRYRGTLIGLIVVVIVICAYVALGVLAYQVRP